MQFIYSNCFKQIMSVNNLAPRACYFSLVEIWLVEVENFGFLPFSNWPDFDKKKWSKIGHFGPQMAQNEDLSDFFTLLCPTLS